MVLVFRMEIGPATRPGPNSKPIGRFGTDFGAKTVQ